MELQDGMEILRWDEERQLKKIFRNEIWSTNERGQLLFSVGKSGVVCKKKDGRSLMWE